MDTKSLVVNLLHVYIGIKAKVDQLQLLGDVTLFDEDLDAIINMILRASGVADRMRAYEEELTGVSTHNSRWFLDPPWNAIVAVDQGNIGRVADLLQAYAGGSIGYKIMPGRYVETVALDGDAADLLVSFD